VSFPPFFPPFSRGGPKIPRSFSSLSPLFSWRGHRYRASRLIAGSYLFGSQQCPGKSCGGPNGLGGSFLPLSPLPPLLSFPPAGPEAASKRHTGMGPKFGVSVRLVHTSPFPLYLFLPFPPPLPGILWRLMSSSGGSSTSSNRMGFASSFSPPFFPLLSPPPLADLLQLRHFRPALVLPDGRR